MKEKIIITALVLFLVLFLVLLIGCSEVINPPSFVVTSEEKREEAEGLDKVGYVDLTIKNMGGPGDGTVYVKVTQGTNYWTKESSLFLTGGESKNLSFRFSEIVFWTLDPWDIEVNVT